MVEVTELDVYAAALQWCGEKDRETSLDDIRYFQNNWQSLPGFYRRVEAFARHRIKTTANLTTENAALAARVEALEGALRGIANAESYVTADEMRIAADIALAGDPS